MASNLTEKAHFLMEQVHSQLRDLYLHSAEQIEVIQQKQQQEEDPFVAIDKDDQHSIMANRHLRQLNGNVQAIDKVISELSDENSHLHMRLSTLRTHLDGATSRLHDSMRNSSQKSMRHWEELRSHLDSCHSELMQTRESVMIQLQETKMKLAVEYVKNQEYENAVREFQSLEGDYREHLITMLDGVYAGNTEGALKVTLFLEQLKEQESIEGFVLLIDQLSKNDQLFHPVILVILSVVAKLKTNDKMKRLVKQLEASVQFLGNSIRSARYDQFTTDICRHLSLSILACLMKESYQEDIRAISEFVSNLPLVQQRIQCCLTLHSEIQSKGHISENGIIILIHLIKNTMDLPGFPTAANSDSLVLIKKRLPEPLADIFWRKVRMRFGRYYMEAKTGHVVHFSRGLSWDYLSSKAGKHELVPYNGGEEFEIRNVLLQQFLVEKEHHLRWSPKEGDRWRLIPRRSAKGKLLFSISNCRTGNSICSCMKHSYSSMEPETENELGIRFRCFKIGTEEEEGHFDVKISRFRLEREISKCKWL